MVTQRKGCLTPFMVGALLIVCVSATLLKRGDQNAITVVKPSKVVVTKPTRTPKAMPVPEATAVAICDTEWLQMVEDTMQKWEQVTGETGIDALVKRYDKMPMPHGCGDDVVLDNIDTAIRLGLANQKTAYMLTDKAKQKKYFATALVQYQLAEESINEWKR